MIIVVVVVVTVFVNIMCITMLYPFFPDPVWKPATSVVWYVLRLISYVLLCRLYFIVIRIVSFEGRR